MRTALEITKHVPTYLSLKELEPLAKQVFRHFPEKLAGRKQVVLTLVFVSDKEIRKLNKHYRGKDCPTDVLSFSYLNEKDMAKDEPIGELIISMDTLRKQAHGQKHSYLLEAKILFVHGLLHIFGFDHEQKKDLKEMLAFERKFLGDNAGLIQRSGLE